MADIVDIYCPLCRRYLATVKTDMRGTVNVRIPCPRCKGEAQQRVTAVQTTTSRETS